MQVFQQMKIRRASFKTAPAGDALTTQRTKKRRGYILGVCENENEN